MLGHRIGVGFRFLWSQYEEVAGLSVSIPHPTLLNRYGNDVDVSPILERKDWMFDFNAQYVHNDPRWRYVLLGGPTYFRTSHEMVRSIAYSQAFTSLGTNLVSITGAPSDTVKGSAWGFNVGGDVAFFPWRHVGVGGGALFNNGRIQVIDPLSGSKTDLTMGSTSFMFGPRFRF